MRRILIVTLLALSPFLVGWTFHWDPVTQYTDNTAIPAGKVVYYDAWVDGTKFYNRGVIPSVAIPAPGSGAAHLYEVAAVVDNVSSAKAGLNWTSPLSSPQGPGGLRVAP